MAFRFTIVSRPPGKTVVLASVSATTWTRIDATSKSGSVLPAAWRAAEVHSKAAAAKHKRIDGMNVRRRPERRVSRKTFLRRKRQNLRLLLRLQHQFRRQKRLHLILRHMRPVHHVPHELRAERQHHIRAVNMMLRLCIHQEQMIAALTPADVDILPEFDVT